jgi:hypothetical protein
MEGGKALIESKKCPCGRKVALKHQAVLGEDARVVSVLHHVSAILNNIKLQDDLLVGYNTLGFRARFVASIDHVGITKTSGSEVCFVYPLNLWRKGHSVDTPISEILSTDVKAFEISCLSNALYYPDQNITDIAQAILKGEDPLALQAAIRAMSFKEANQVDQAQGFEAAPVTAGRSERRPGVSWARRTRTAKYDRPLTLMWSNMRALGRSANSSASWLA